MALEFEFNLPIGFQDGEKFYRNGAMRRATVGDELSTQDGDVTFNNPRNRDLLLLSKVITRLGPKTDLKVSDLENLFEADFIYLQLIFQSINVFDDMVLRVHCPQCEIENSISLSDVFNKSGAKK